MTRIFAAISAGSLMLHDYKHCLRAGMMGNRTELLKHKQSTNEHRRGEITSHHVTGAIRLCDPWSESFTTY